MHTSLSSTFASALLPILAISVVGFLLGRVRDVDPEPLNTVTMYTLAPVLVSYSLATTELAGETLAALTIGVIAYHAAMLLVAGGVARLAGISDPFLGTLILIAAFPNSENYGIPVSSFALGDTGRSTAVVYLAVQSVLIYTLGVYIARRGDDCDDVLPGWCVGLERIIRIPLAYAVVATLAARWLGVVPPAGVLAMETPRLVGDSSIPMMFLILDIQLAGADLGSTLSEVGVVTALKMVVTPTVAVGVALVAGFGDPMVAWTFVLESAMPAMVMPLILVAEFGDASGAGSATSLAEFVSAAIFATTLLSVPALSVLIYPLSHGFAV